METMMKACLTVDSSNVAWLTLTPETDQEKSDLAKVAELLAPNEDYSYRRKVTSAIPTSQGDLTFTIRSFNSPPI